jgi:thiamine-phosphate pyrophosphorylase
VSLSQAGNPGAGNPGAGHARGENSPHFTLPRFYPILDSHAAQRYGVEAIRAAEQILAGGARILQFRHKGFYSRDVVVMMERMAALCREARVPFAVNDRADLAAILGKSQVGKTQVGKTHVGKTHVGETHEGPGSILLHLGQDDLPPAAARKMVGPKAIIGFSTHNEQQLLAAAGEPVNYLALGPVFGTASKKNPDPVVGLPELTRLVIRLRAFSELPLVGIGGITRENVVSVLDAGADSVAVIGDLFPEDAGTAPSAIRSRVEEWIKLTTD